MIKMDILFIYPSISVDERYSRKVGDVGGNLPPLGIAQLAAFLREKGFEVGVIDAVALNYTVDELTKKVLKLNPKIVGFSALTSNFHRAVITASATKNRFPNILTIIGGHHATIMSVDVLKENPCFDLIVYGEGELTIEELLKRYKKDNWEINKFLSNYKLLKEIKGICFRKNRDIIKNERRGPIKNLDELPFIARDLLPMDKYIPLPNQYKRSPVIHMVVIRGCPFNCSFCSNNAVFGRKIRAMSPERVISEIKYVMKKYKAKEISFWDDMMTVNKDWMHRFCDLLIKDKLNITWTCYSRVDCVDYKLLRHMKKAGCWNIFFGFESGNQVLLDNINKGINLKQIEEANRLCKKVGIEVRASFMIALPGETPRMAKRTIKFAKKLNPDYAQFSITTPFPGTKLYEDAEKYGKLTKDFSEYNGWEAVFVPYGYKNRKEIEDMEERAMKEFYMRPRYIINRIRKINSFEDIKRYFNGLRFVLGFVKKK